MLELLVATDDIKSLIHAGGPVAELLSTARSQGLTTLMHDGIRKRIQG